MNNYLTHTKVISTILMFILLMMSPILVSASDVSMADTMRENGKIYVVVAVVLVVTLGMIFYLVSVDKKIKKLEAKINEKTK